jgi:hypothetical protein
VSPDPTMTDIAPRVPGGLSFVNVGLAGFAEPIAATGADVRTVEWAPAAGDAEMARLLAALITDRRVGRANETALAAFGAVDPVAVRVRPAREVIAALADRRLLHAGPPIPLDEMCGPMLGALAGAACFEGWAADPDDAVERLRRGEIVTEPCHHHAAVGPMAGVISPSMPVWVVGDASSGRQAFSNLNEGLGKVLRFGANGPEVLDRMRWMADVLAPALDDALQRLDGLPLTPIMAQALHMGDELHNRNAAATGQLLKVLAPVLATGAGAGSVARVLEFIGRNDHFFLNLSMAAAKLRLDAASGVPGSSMVTAMARNGVTFGIRLSGTGDRWFTAPAPVVDGLFFAGYSAVDAAADLGDSAITETAGLGGFAMAAAPAIVRFVGGRAADALANTARMSGICITHNPAFTVPTLDFAPLPLGIDARLVVDTRVEPVINTGIAHREPGVGQIGAGITQAPAPCFHDAVRALAAELGHRAVDPVLAGAAGDDDHA